MTTGVGTRSGAIYNRHGTCPACGTEQKVTVSGVMYWHWKQGVPSLKARNRMGGLPPNVYTPWMCPGTSQPVVPAVGR